VSIAYIPCDYTWANNWPTRIEKNYWKNQKPSCPSTPPVIICGQTIGLQEFSFMACQCQINYSEYPMSNHLIGFSQRLCCVSAFMIKTRLAMIIEPCSSNRKHANAHPPRRPGALRSMGYGACCDRVVCFSPASYSAQEAGVELNENTLAAKHYK